MSAFRFGNSSFQVISSHSPANGFEINYEPANPSSEVLHSENLSSSDRESLYNSETGDCFHTTLKYVSDILLEGDLEDKPYMLQDSLALQAAEKSFYDVLSGKYPPFHQNIESPDDNFDPSSCVSSWNNCFVAANSPEYTWICDQADSESSRFFYSPESSIPVPDLHREVRPFGLFNEVMRNAEKPIPYSYFANSSVTMLSGSPQLEKAVIPGESERAGESSSSNDLRGRKNDQSNGDGYLEEGRRHKQSMVSTEESELLEIIDNSFLRRIDNYEAHPCPLYDESRNEASKKLQQNEQLQASYTRIKRMADKNEKADFWILLTQCAQAIGSGDQRTANESLKQIRQHSTPLGDGHQRFAHYFANGLEARLNGTGRLLTPSSVTAADIIRAYQFYVSVCPFRMITSGFANRTISKVAEKATTLHIIDFGISYGFQWPCFITRISTKPGGPPKIRITGIDFPQPGFRPAERVEETGRRLKRLADKLNVPFEYNAIAQKWETIQCEDLKIERDEVIAVNCKFRMENLIDDTLVLDSPRDAVLKLIKKINPDIFVHGVINGSFNAPYFVRRFREALFHYSALFDMFEATATREDQERLIFEREMLGNEAINVIACEGVERVERPETYKQWQIRNSRMGFRQLPLHQDVMNRVRIAKSTYHKNFVVDEDGHWMRMGWKGRTIYAISAWKPIQY